MHLTILLHFTSGLIFAAMAAGLNGGAIYDATARRCGVAEEKTAQRVFANPDNKGGWHEYKNKKEVPQLELDAGAFAALWTNPDGKLLVKMYEPGEDWTTFTDYCFERKGQLSYLRFEVRTGWTWGFREEGPVSKGVLKVRHSEFFDTGTDQPIGRPAEADAISEALRPRILLRGEQLPFYRLLTK